MTTPLELPEDLVRTIRSRAVATGSTLDDAVAEILRKSLAMSHAVAPVVTVPKKLPHIQAKAADPSSEPSMTTQQFCDWLKDFEL